MRDQQSMDVPADESDRERAQEELDRRFGSGRYIAEFDADGRALIVNSAGTIVLAEGCIFLVAVYRLEQHIDLRWRTPEGP